MSVAVVLAATCAASAAASCVAVPADARCRALHSTAPASSDDVAVLRGLRRVWRKREPTGSGRRVPATLDLLAAALEAGLPPALALAEVAAVQSDGGDRLERVVAMLDLSVDSGGVWRLLADDPDFGALGQTLARAERSGAPLAESVHALADEARRDARATRLDRARSVGVRTAAPLGLCFLPAFLLIAVVPTIIGLIGQAF